MPKYCQQGAEGRAIYRRKATQDVHKKNEKTHQKGEHKYHRDWEVHGNLSTVSGGHSWQDYDDQPSGGLAGRQRVPGLKYEENTKKTAKIRWSCGFAMLSGPYLAKCGGNRRSLQLKKNTRTKRHRRRSEYNTKVERNSVHRHKITENRRKSCEVQTQMERNKSPWFGSLNGRRLAESEVVGRKQNRKTKRGGSGIYTPKVRYGPGSVAT